MTAPCVTCVATTGLVLAKENGLAERALLVAANHTAAK